MTNSEEFTDAQSRAALLTPNAAASLRGRLEKMVDFSAENGQTVDLKWAVAEWNALNERANETE